MSWRQDICNHNDEVGRSVHMSEPVHNVRGYMATPNCSNVWTYPYDILVSNWLVDYPLNTWRNNNVVITSKRRHFDVITSKWRRFDVITTSLLRNVSAG